MRIASVQAKKMIIFILYHTSYSIDILTFQYKIELLYLKNQGNETVSLASALVVVISLLYQSLIFYGIADVNAS